MGAVLIVFLRGYYIIIDPELRNVLMFSSIVPSLIIFIVFFCIKLFDDIEANMSVFQAAIGWYINFYNRNRISNVA